MYFRIKPARHCRYLQIDRSVRVNAKVRQEVIATLGRMDVLEASGQLERLLRSGLKYCQKNPPPDVIPAARGNAPAPRS